ncbi:MAG: hypothetical protein GY796_08315 [Chloroflexi bacterium]|nr:hypothetical protein [Chloroflexota bacterium]
MSEKNNRLQTTPDSSVFLDTSLPNVARIFDYLAGGSANFESDRQATAQILQIIPSLGKWVRLRRAFVQEATRQLHQAGFRQFLDLGSGMPSEDHIHAFAPDAHIVYSDINPVAVRYGQSLFADQENIQYIQGNVREIDKILYSSEVRACLNPQERIAIGLNGLLLFFSEEDNRQLAHQLYQWASPGSKIFVVFQTRGDKEIPQAYDDFFQLARSAGLPIQLYTLQKCISLMAPWQIEDVIPIVQFLGLPEDFISAEDQAGIQLAFYAAFVTKQLG